jgi:TatA/E family protein of Tat protein translocase
MFGTLGGPEIILILVLALIIFGPRKLPDIGRSVGKMIVEFRRASNDFRRTIEDEVEAEKLKAAVELPRIDAPAEPAAPGTVPASQGPPAAPAEPQSPEGPAPAGEAK